LETGVPPRKTAQLIPSILLGVGVAAVQIILLNPLKKVESKK
jgi:hypothetical protein